MGGEGIDRRGILDGAVDGAVRPHDPGFAGGEGVGIEAEPAGAVGVLGEQMNELALWVLAFEFDPIVGQSAVVVSVAKAQFEPTDLEEEGPGCGDR